MLYNWENLNRFIVFEWYKCVMKINLSGVSIKGFKSILEESYRISINKM